MKTNNHIPGNMSGSTTGNSTENTPGNTSGSTTGNSTENTPGNISGSTTGNSTENTTRNTSTSNSGNPLGTIPGTTTENILGIKPGYSPSYQPPMYTPRPIRPQQPIPFDQRDVLFSVFFLALAYGFIYTCSNFRHFDGNLSVFTAAYAVVVLSYCYFRGKQPAKESWFWLAIMLCMGIPYAFWTVLYGLQVLGLMVTAAYWTLTLNGNLMEKGRSSQWVMVDTINALFGVPFANMNCQPHILKNAVRRTKIGRRVLTVGLGLCIAVPILAIALPLLSRADMGFRDLLLRFFNYIFKHFFATLMRFLFAIPVSFYLFGLSYGSFYERETKRFHPEEIRNFWRSARKVPNLAVNTAAITVCLIYLLFIGLQAQYLFAAFTGKLPSYLTYAEYARRGFFELCQVAVLNAFVLLCANGFSRTSRENNQVLRWLNVIFSILTLLLIATAMSKMLLYIWAYGFTIKRIVTTVFMIWLTAVFSLTILWQWKRIPIIRWILLIGAVLFAILCVFPIQLWITA